MRFNKDINFREGYIAPAHAGEWEKRSLERGWRQISQLIFILVFTLSLGACSSNPLESLNPFKETEDESQRGTIGFVEGFLGGVAVDEPRASLIGRDILSSGGNAVDVAVAVSFALSVTMPSSASIGGGGLCLVHDAENNATETLDFLPRAPAKFSPAAVQPIAVPGMIRGLAVLHAKYGKLPWSQLVSPAETLSRFGIRVSRAFANDLKRLPPAAAADPEFSKTFGQGKGGGIIREGDFLKQLELSAVWGRLRLRGAGDFYNGLMSRQFVAAVAKTGGVIDVKDMRAYKPLWLPTLKVSYIKNVVFHFPVMPGPSGVLAAQTMGMLIEDNDWDDYSMVERSHLMAEVTGRAAYYRGRWLRNDGGSSVAPESLISKDAVERLLNGFQEKRHTPFPNARSGPGGVLGNNVGTGFVAVDREGGAVACVLTLSNPFGVGRITPGMGIMLSALPGPLGRGHDSFSTVLGVNSVHNVFYFGAAGSGSPAVPGIMAGIAMGAVLPKTGENLEMAIGARRVYNSGDPDLTYYEQGTDTGVVSALGNMGHRLSPASGMGLVNAVYCPAGIPNEDVMACSTRTDPRGFGLASGAE